MMSACKVVANYKSDVISVVQHRLTLDKRFRVQGELLPFMGFALKWTCKGKLESFIALVSNLVTEDSTIMPSGFCSCRSFFNTEIIGVQ